MSSSPHVTKSSFTVCHVVLYVRMSLYLINSSQSAVRQIIIYIINGIFH